jgi:hypothetical protein
MYTFNQPLNTNDYGNSNKLPDGDYIFRISDIKDGFAKSDNQRYVSLILTVVDGPFKGLGLSEMCFVPHEPQDIQRGLRDDMAKVNIGMGKLARYARANGIQQLRTPYDLKGKIVRATVETKNNYQNIKNVKEYVSQTATNMGNNVGFSGNNFMVNNVNPTFQQQPVSNVGIQQPILNSGAFQQQPQEEMNDEMPF